MQPFDYTTFTAVCYELRNQWLPARLEQVYQRDRFTISLHLRTLQERAWLDIAWHPQAARICVGERPPKTPDTFTFSEQLRHQLNGLALVNLQEIAPWERAIDLQFAKRPGDAPLWHLYVEIMGKYSNVILTNQDKLIVTCAHQVSHQQSRLRPLQTGQPYEFPPSLNDPIPSLNESLERWQARISLIPGSLKQNLLKNYRGLSSALVLAMLKAANLEPERSTDSLTLADWQNLFSYWQIWLNALINHKFSPHQEGNGYSVIDWQLSAQPDSVQTLLNQYYTSQINQQEFSQIKHQLTQKISNLLSKLNLKADEFKTKLQQSDEAEKWKNYADLLMANLQAWQPGMSQIILTDFMTEAPVTIALEPESNAIKNAQNLYKRHQKLKRARQAVEPLLQETLAEISYLEQVESSLLELETYREMLDLETLQEIRDELIEQKYLVDPNLVNRMSQSGKNNKPENLNYIRSVTPNGFCLLIGRNNFQNDLLTFRVATDYDLWFHAQEIPGAHVLLRLTPGAVPESIDLQFTADVAAYHSRSRQSEQVPIVYTQPKYVYKPKGAKPGMVVYKHEQVIWGKPDRAF